MFISHTLNREYDDLKDTIDRALGIDKEIEGGRPRGRTRRYQPNTCQTGFGKYPQRD